MGQIIIPEVQLFNTIKNILNYIRVDFEGHSNEQDTLLYRILGDNQLQRYEMFTQAKTVFLAEKDNPRILDVNMFFNLERAGIPTIHITLPAEQPNKDGIGIDEGFQSEEIVVPIDNPAGNYQVPTYTRRFATQYNIVITSDNSNEVVLIYHVMRALLIPTIDHFSVVGLENVKLSGRDIQNMNTIVPTHIFMRNIGVAMEYEVSVGDFYPQEIITKIITEFEIDTEDEDISG